MEEKRKGNEKRTKEKRKVNERKTKILFTIYIRNENIIYYLYKKKRKTKNKRKYYLRLPKRKIMIKIYK